MSEASAQQAAEFFLTRNSDDNRHPWLWRLIGDKLGTIFARAGQDVVFSYSRSCEKLGQLAKDAGKNARAGTPADAARHADVLLLAVHWTCVDDVLAQAGTPSDKTLLTCSLPMSKDDTHMVNSADPHRFRTKRQLWTYSGFDIETQSSADHRSVDRQLQRVKKQSSIRGLNRNCNHDLKNLFKLSGLCTGTLHDCTS